ncbi:MAG TPA: peptidylprolyl isomerase [Ktedonobacterales bacterium]
MLSFISARRAHQSAAPRAPHFALMVLVALSMLLAACAPSATNDPVLALRINGTPITLSSYQQVLALFDASAALQGSGTSGPLAWQSPNDRQTWTSAKSQTLNFFTSTTVIKQELDRQHLTVNQKDIDAAVAQLNAQIANARAQSQSNPANAGLKALVEAATPDAIRLLAEQEAYTLVLADKASAPTVKAHGILVNSQAEANSLLASLKSGGDFAALAKQHSLDTTSGANGGDLGTVYVGQFVPAFDTQIFRKMQGNGYAVVALGSGYGVFSISGRGATPLSDLKNPQTQQQYAGSWINNVLVPEARVENYVA